MSHLFRRRAQAGSGRRSGWSVLPGPLVLAVVLVAITAVAVVSYTRMLTGMTQRQMQNTADLAQVFLNEQNAATAATIESVTRAADVKAALELPGSPQSRALVKNVVDVLSAGNPDAVTVLVTDSYGRVLGDKPALVPMWFDVSQRPWYRQASRSRGFAVSPVFTSIVTGESLTTVSVPVREGTRLLGVVAVGRGLDSYQEFVQSYASQRGIRLTVIDSAGAAVADGGRDVLNPSARVDERLRIGRAAAAAKPGWISATSMLADPSTTGNWRVVSQEPAAVALRPARIFRAGAITVAAGILLASLLFGKLRRRAARARREAERKLEESHSRMRDVADSSPNVVFQLTPAGQVIFVSKAARRALGREPDDLIGTDLILLLEAETGPSPRARLERVLERGEPAQFTARTTVGEAGRIVEVSLRIGRTDDETEIWGTLHDITDRRTASDQVEALFRLSEDFIAVLDRDGRLVQVNPVWTEAFGTDPAQLLGRRFAAMFLRSDADRVDEHLAALADAPATVTFETRYVRDGITRTLLWASAPDPVRGLVYAIGRDITEHKELARALAEARDRALETSRLKSEFVATMSHEIRTPMNGVIGLTDLLLDTRLDSTQRRYVEGVRTAGEALLAVINDILDFSKIEAGRLLLDSVDFRLEDVVDDVVTLVRQTSSAKGLELTVDYLPGVPLALNGDPGRLRQILLNLTHNAVKFTSEGGVSVVVEPGPARDDGGVAVLFKVVDSGIGIDPARLDELFEPFRQADEGAARAYGGTGLGLSICRRLATLMGGSITASGELGQGATFVAELVFIAAADWGRSVRGRDARGLAVIVVDDNEVNRLVMITQLNRWGMRPVAAASADEAMELLTGREAPAGGYDLAVVDRHMPGVDGLQLVGAMRRVPALQNLPVILLTSDQGIDAEVALEHGISARLTKPVQQSELFDALTRVGMPNSARAETEPAARAEPSAPGSQRSHDGDFRLLLVEDNDINQTVALGILSQLGYQADVAGDGLQALTMADQRAYDAILMDCQMPRMDGYTATVELRKRQGTRETPIIAMTAATFAADRQRCFDSGMDDFIAKPVRAATLQATLHRWLRADEGAESPPRAAGPPAGRPGERPGLSDHHSVVREFMTAAHERVEPGEPGEPGGRVDRPGRGDPASKRSDQGRRTVGTTVPSPRFSGGSGTDPATVGRPEGEGMPPATERPDGATRPAGATEVADVAEIAEVDERIAELLGDGSELEVELVREIVGSFLARTVDLLQRLTLAVAADDAEATYLHAHSLAGAGLNLGTVEVVRISRQIEQDAKAGRPGLAVPRLADLEVALDRARVRLRELAAALPDPESADL